MIGFPLISTLSTMNDYNHITNKVNLDEEKEKGEIPECLKCKDNYCLNEENSCLLTEINNCLKCENG